MKISEKAVYIDQKLNAITIDVDEFGLLQAKINLDALPFDISHIKSNIPITFISAYDQNNSIEHIETTVLSVKNNRLRLMKLHYLCINSMSDYVLQLDSFPGLKKVCIDMDLCNSYCIQKKESDNLISYCLELKKRGIKRELKYLIYDEVTDIKTKPFLPAFLSVFDRVKINDLRKSLIQELYSQREIESIANDCFIMKKFFLKKYKQELLLPYQKKVPCQACPHCPGHKKEITEEIRNNFKNKEKKYLQDLENRTSFPENEDFVLEFLSLPHDCSSNIHSVLNFYAASTQLMKNLILHLPDPYERLKEYDKHSLSSWLYQWNYGLKNSKKNLLFMHTLKKLVVKQCRCSDCHQQARIKSEIVQFFSYDSAKAIFDVYQNLDQIVFKFSHRAKKHTIIYTRDDFFKEDQFRSIRKLFYLIGMFIGLCQHKSIIFLSFFYAWCMSKSFIITDKGSIFIPYQY